MTDKNEKDKKDEKGEPDSKYRLIQVAAKRARQLQNGARPQVSSDTTKATKLAMEEVKAGKVEWTTTQKGKTDAEIASETLEGDKPKTDE